MLPGARTQTSGKIKFPKGRAFKECLPFGVTEGKDMSLPVAGVAKEHLARADPYLDASTALTP